MTGQIKINVVMVGKSFKVLLIKGLAVRNHTLSLVPLIQLVLLKYTGIEGIFSRTLAALTFFPNRLNLKGFALARWL